MKRARICHENLDCAECGAPIKALENYEYCGKCGEPVHVGCAEWLGNEYFCPVCAKQVKKEIDHDR